MTTTTLFSSEILNIASSLFDRALETKLYHVDCNSCQALKHIKNIEINISISGINQQDPAFYQEKINNYQKSLKQLGISENATALEYLQWFEGILENWQPNFDQFNKQKELEVKELRNQFLAGVVWRFPPNVDRLVSPTNKISMWSKS